MTRIQRCNVIVLVLLLAGAAFFSTGCFGKGGGSSATAAQTAVPNLQAGNIVPGSVTTVKAPDGSVTVSWKTQAPSMGNNVIAGTLFFEEHPLYDNVIPEPAKEPTVDHAVTVPAVNGKTAFAVTDGAETIDDNAGRGYVVE